MFLCLPRDSCLKQCRQTKKYADKRNFPGVCLFSKLIFPGNANIYAKNHAPLLKSTKMSASSYVKPRYHNSFPWTDVATGIHYGLIYFNIDVETVRTAVKYLPQNISAEQGRLLSAQHSTFERLSSHKERSVALWGPGCIATRGISSPSLQWQDGLCSALPQPGRCWMIAERGGS